MPHKRKRRWCQFSLRTLLLLTTLTALLLSGVAWWQSTRAQRALQRAIRECDSMSKGEKDLLCSLVWQREGGELLEHLVGPFYSELEPARWAFELSVVRALGPHLTWHTSFLDVQNRPRRVFLLSGAFRSNWGTIVLTDDRHRLIQWKEVHVGGELKSAAVKPTRGAVELSVIADTVGLHSPDKARGTYRFLLDDHGITACPVQWDEAYASRQREQVMERLRAGEANR